MSIAIKLNNQKPLKQLFFNNNFNKWKQKKK